MSTTPSSGPQWTGDMLDSPQLVAAFSAQLRRNINSYAGFVAGIRRDAEAMWAANPPEGYGSFEAWWRARWVRGPLRGIQEHLERAAALTHALEARYRRGRHEIPAARQAAAAREQPVLRPPRPGTPPPLPRTGQDGQSGQDGHDFMDMVRERRRRSA